MKPDDYRLSAYVWRALIAWCIGAGCIGLWALYTLAKAVL